MQVLIPACDTASLLKARLSLLNRSLLYNYDNGKLYVKYNDVLNDVSAKVSADSNSIVFNDKEELTLSKDVVSNNVDITGDGSISVTITSDNRFNMGLTTIPLLNYKTKDCICGNLIVKNKNTYKLECYTINLDSYGKGDFFGIGYSEKPKLIKLTIDDRSFVALRFLQPDAINKIYFCGFLNVTIPININSLLASGKPIEFGEL